MTDIIGPQILPAGDFKTVTVFLPEGREALLYVPRPFYKKDKVAIKRQLNALLADDEDWSDEQAEGIRIKRKV